MTHNDKFALPLEPPQYTYLEFADLIDTAVLDSFFELVLRYCIPDSPLPPLKSILGLGNGEGPLRLFLW